MSTNPDNEKDIFNPEETFPEETFSTDLGKTPPPPLSAPEVKTNGGAKKWIGFGLILLGIAGYLAYHNWSLKRKPENNVVSVPLPSQPNASSKESKQARLEQQFAATQAAAMGKTVPSGPMPTPKPAPVPPPAPSPNPVSSPPTPTASTTAFENNALQQLQVLNVQIGKNLEQIQNLEDALQGITQTISKLNDDVHLMDNRILALSGSTTSLSAELGSLKRDFSQVKHSLVEEGIDFNVPPPPSHQYPRSVLRPTCPVNQPPVYIVHAIIPGRAWLKGPGGQITTITEGDTLGDYGKVLVIDAASGMVLTQSGVTFR